MTPPFLHQGESIVIIMERHPLIFFSNALIYIFLLFVPVALWFAVQMGGVQIPAGPFITPLEIAFTSIYYLYIWLYMLHTFFDYALDTWIVTTERIINIEQKGIFSRELAEQELSRIQDVTAEIKGIFPTLFDYGNISVQTAAEKERFLFKQVKQPQKIVGIISELMKTHSEQ